jgi:hypothetical protein
VPVLLIAFGNWRMKGSSFGIKDALELYAQWGYWLWLTVLIAGQALLLLLPINIAERRLPARRPLKTPIIVSAFLLANLCFAGIFSILCAIFTDKAFEIFNLPNFFSYIANTLNHNQAKNVSIPDWQSDLSIFVPILIFWLIWATIFRHATQNDDPAALMQRLKRWLLRGSILELLVAVPSHVIVRRRDDCCAPAGTFWGIATGISVMLLCFGPGVFFLFVERCQRLKAKNAGATHSPKG